MSIDSIWCGFCDDTCSAACAACYKIAGSGTLCKMLKSSSAQKTPMFIDYFALDAGDNPDFGGVTITSLTVNLLTPAQKHAFRLI